MADRNVIVRLKANIADFKRGMDEAAKATEKVGSKGQESGWKASTALGEVVQSATKHSEAWSTAGTALLGYGAAVTGITAAVLKTGISYNTLQQQSRAALTTLLGGAEAANAQMDKLDDFARTSPFSKQVFIEAQRQLIGFGYEAERVVPILDAIQNAVAATGGSNQDIAELASIIAKIGASAKISAVDLDMFANRGVDAATLIGTQMGKTGAQIREEITAGTLDAGEAIVALTAGMQERFGGAAAGVKNTVSGAFDRVKAAIRDVSSEWTAWLVNPEAAEGGALAVGLNKIADILRGFQSMPDPFKNVLGGLFAVSGIAATAASSFLLLMPRIVETKAAFATLATTMPRATAALTAAKNTLMGPWGVAIAAATIGLGVWAAKQGESRARVEELTASLDAQTGAVTANTRELIAKELQDRGLLEAAQLLGIEYGVVTDAIMGDTAARRILNEATAEAIRLEKEHQDAMMGGSAYKRQGDAARGLQGALGELGGELEQATADHEQLTSEVEGSTAAQDRAAEAAKRLADQTQLAADAQRDLASAHIEQTNALLASINSSVALEQAMTKLTEAAEKNGKTLDYVTGEMDLSTEAGQNNALAITAAAKAMEDKVRKDLTAGKSTDEVTRAMEEARAEFIESVTAMGASSTAANQMADDFGFTRQRVHELTLEVEDMPSAKAIEITTNADVAIAKIVSLQRSIDNLKGKTVIIATQFSGPGARMVGPGQVGITSADGNLLNKSAFGMVRAYAGGGFFDGQIGAQQPQIRPYAGPRGLLWGEEGSGPWEAFISGHPAKRDRSMRIWLDVGRRLGAIAGHADGAVRQYGVANHHYYQPPASRADVAPAALASAVGSALHGARLSITGMSGVRDEMYGELQLALGRG